MKMRWMKYVIQFLCMASDVAIPLAVIYVAHFFIASIETWPIVVLVIALYFSSFRPTGIFFAWRPKNIRSFFKNMRAAGM